jgi:hypothetical protein
VSFLETANVRLAAAGATDGAVRFAVRVAPGAQARLLVPLAVADIYVPISLRTTLTYSATTVRAQDPCSCVSVYTVVCVCVFLCVLVGDADVGSRAAAAVCATRPDRGWGRPRRGSRAERAPATRRM